MWTPRYLAEVTVSRVVQWRLYFAFTGLVFLVKVITSQLEGLEVFFPFLETVKVGLECVGVMHCFDDTIQQAVISKHPNCGTNSTGEVIDVNKK